VLTIGRAGGRGEVTAPESALAARGIKIIETDRGGRVTYHGPGQIVGYPVMDLRAWGGSLHAYVRSIEEALLRTLAEYGVSGRRVPGRSGAWVDKGKIAAVGIAVKKWITRHGFSFNVDVDLSAYDLFVPCGIRDAGVTSLSAALGRKVDMSEARDRIAANFARVFDVEYAEQPGILSNP
jgi:lipoate-protein ligase B